ncbi:MAG: intermembrane phospholipid transport protein YdbH family protein, partial [Hyphococcus sp.]
MRAEISASGEISLPGFRFAGGQSAEQAPALPFEALSLDDVSLVLQTPEGRAEGKVEGSYEAGAGGAARIHLASARAGTSAVLIEDGRVTLDAVIGPDDALSISGDMTADVQAFAGRIRDLVVSVDGKIDSWRAPVTGGAIVDVQSAIADIAAFPVLSAMDAERLASIFGGPVSAIEASGRFTIEFVEGRVAASLADQPLELRADTGARFVITENEEVSFLSKYGDEASASFSFSLEDAPLTAGGYVDAEQRDGAWFVNFPLQVDAFRSPVVAFDNASSVVRMTASDAGVDADITATFALTELNIGRFSVSDAPISARFLASAERNAKTIVVSAPDGECLRLARAKLSIDQQDTEASLRDARLCADDGRYIAIDLENGFESRFGGFLSADNLRYRLGQTRIAGQAPLIRFEGVYQPLQHLTRASGDISDGQVTLNDVLVFSSADGNFQFSLDSRIMRASADLNSVRVSQRASAPWVAPVIGAGQARLEGRMIDFDYVLRTPGGRNLGAGTGVHNVADAQGESRFTLDGLTFEDTALQPDLLAPALRGIIGRTTGAVGGDMRFAWAPGPGGLKSSGEFILENVTFGGPTRVVTQTRGVNGRLAFASLWPLQTDGEQSVSVSGVDFGALQLDQGEIRFAMPGDETLRIIEAEFPWFGGMLGVYDANASMADGAATAPLRADDIDLSQVLDYFDVDGLSGEGILSGVLPLVVEDAKASIVDGVLQSEGPGAIRYVG